MALGPAKNYQSRTFSTNRNDKVRLEYNLWRQLKIIIRISFLQAKSTNLVTRYVKCQIAMNNLVDCLSLVNFDY